MVQFILGNVQSYVLSIVLEEKRCNILSSYQVPFHDDLDMISLFADDLSLIDDSFKNVLQMNFRRKMMLFITRWKK
jgi:hypothetical protein